MYFCPLRSFREKGSGEVTLGCVGKHCHYGFAWAEPLCELKRGEHVRAAGDACEKTFLAGKVASAFQSLFVRDYADVRLYLCVEIVRNESVADAHLQMRADRSAGKDGGVLRFHCPDFDSGILRLKDLADSAQCSASADP